MERPRTVAILGVGLIGGSVGLAIKARGAAGRVVGYDLDPERIRRALELGAIDEGATDLAHSVADADVAVIAAPVTATVALVLEVARLGRESLLITDVGSTKGRIVAEVEADPTARSRFVGCHPIAGSERQGVEFASASLFEGRVCALTSTARTAPDRVERTRAFWVALGARLLEIDPILHDTQLALTSHLPHAVASTLAAVIPPDLFPLAAGAYRDGTRVAGAEGALWAGIFLDNRGAVLDAIGAFEAYLSGFREALEAGDRTRLISWWATGREHRTIYRDATTPPARMPVDL